MSHLHETDSTWRVPGVVLALSVRLEVLTVLAGVGIIPNIPIDVYRAGECAVLYLAARVNTQHTYLARASTLDQAPPAQAALAHLLDIFHPAAVV